jgi:hypothetical protein
MKIAFCFLSYGDIEHQTVWIPFFSQGTDHAIFLHRADGLQTSTMPGCIVVPPIKTAWGTFSLLQAQQIMFEAAHKDPDITKFVILSGDSIPLYTFPTVYEKLTKDNKGYMRRIANLASVMTTEKTIHTDAWPAEKPWNGLFISQWVVLNRTHVELLKENWTMLQTVFQHAAIPDEYMYYIFFSGFGHMDSFHPSSHMYVSHAKRAVRCDLNHHAIPMTYHRPNFAPIDVERIYNTDCLFLRKVCPKTKVYMDWTKQRPLRDNGARGMMNMMRNRR